MAKKIDQIQIDWKDEPFALVPLTAVDGDKIASEATRKLKDTLESEKRQRELKGVAIENHMAKKYPDII